MILRSNTLSDISSVDLPLEEHRVDVMIEYAGKEGACPNCGAICPRYDVRHSRTWYHLDTMQFASNRYCETPRVKCGEQGVKGVAVPWTGQNGRFTLLFEAFAIRVLSAARLIWHPLYHADLRRTI